MDGWGGGGGGGGGGVYGIPDIPGEMGRKTSSKSRRKGTLYSTLLALQHPGGFCGALREVASLDPDRPFGDLPKEVT